MNKKALSVLAGFCILGCLMPAEAQARDHHRHHRHNDGLHLAAGIVNVVANGVRAITGQPTVVVTPAPAPVVVMPAPAPVVVTPAPVVVAPRPVIVVPPRRHYRPAPPPPPRRHHGRPMPPPHRGRGR